MYHSSSLSTATFSAIFLLIFSNLYKTYESDDDIAAKSHIIYPIPHFFTFNLFTKLGTLYDLNWREYLARGIICSPLDSQEECWCSKSAFYRSMQDFAEIAARLPHQQRLIVQIILQAIEPFHQPLMPIHLSEVRDFD